jgi:hypothetical protein
MITTGLSFRSNEEAEEGMQGTFLLLVVSLTAMNGLVKYE